MPDDTTESLIPEKVHLSPRKPEPTGSLGTWLLANRVTPAGPEAGENKSETHARWKVMTLMGVD